jgi:hypothetical protein
MTNLTWVQDLVVCCGPDVDASCYFALNFVIPTGAYPDFLLSGTENGLVCGFP